jgi:hypothetical protein
MLRADGCLLPGDVRPAVARVADVFVRASNEGRHHGHMTDLRQRPAAQERSTGELVKLVSEQVSVLVRDELKLAQLEMTRKGKQAGSGAGLLGGGGLIALYGVGCLIACVIIALSGAVAAWLAALIVGGVLLAVAGVAAAAGERPPGKGHTTGA